MVNISFERNTENFVSGLSAIYFVKLLDDIGWNFFPPQLIKFIKQEIVVRQIFLFLLVLIAIEILESETEDTESEIPNKIIGAIFLYFTVLMIPKQTIVFALVEFGLFIVAFIYYYNIQNNDNEGYYDNLRTVVLIFVSVVFVGSVFYYFKQRRDRGKDFSYLKFLFGSPEGH